MGTLRKKETAVNITKSSLVQLKELASRQEKLLSNKKFISTLPDKGAKIQSFYDKILAEIQRRDQVDETSNLLSKITLQDSVGHMEWEGKKSKSSSQLKVSQEDSDDESDPLRILASHSGTQTGLKTKEEINDPSLVTQSDIEEAKKFVSAYAQKLCEKFDNLPTHERFKPNTPKQRDLAKTGYRSSSENVQKMLGKSWEVTAATPPVPVYDSSEPLSLAASLSLQQEQVQRIKEIQIQEATARLREASTFGERSQLPTKLMAYRTPPDPTRLFEGTPARDKLDDVNEDDESETGGAVFYNIIDDVPEKS